MLNLIALVLASTAVMGQAESNFEHLKTAEPLIGTWQYELTGSDKTTVTQWTFAWTADKNALMISQSISVAGKTTGRMDALFGWDKQRNQIVGHGFATGGVAGKDWVISPGDGRLTIAAGSRTWVFRLDGSDTLILESGGRILTTLQRHK